MIFLSKDYTGWGCPSVRLEAGSQGLIFKGRKLKTKGRVGHGGGGLCSRATEQNKGPNPLE